MHPSFRNAVLALAALLPACSFTSTATHWNGRLDEVGRPIFMKATTNVGMNLLVFIPIIGNITLDEMIEETTSEIAAADGTRVRVVQTMGTNYSLAYWPLTLLITPVTTEVMIAYEPTWAEIETVLGPTETEALRRRVEPIGDPRPEHVGTQPQDG